VDGEQAAVASRPMAVVDGVVMPISQEAVDVARGGRWYPLDQRFKRVFYRALWKYAGVKSDRVRQDIEKLLRHRTGLGLDGRQVRGAYGYEKGIFTASGQFAPVCQQDEDLDLALMSVDPKERKDAERRPDGFGVDEWGSISAEALKACRRKVETVDIGLEATWVHAQLFEWPDFRRAPSKAAIKTWLALHRPGNESLLRDFLKVVWAKRMSPGDKAPKATAFREDDVAVERDEERAAELRLKKLVE